jgi:hypothetical protein
VGLRRHAIDGVSARVRCRLRCGVVVLLPCARERAVIEAAFGRAPALHNGQAAHTSSIRSRFDVDRVCTCRSAAASLP